MTDKEILKAIQNCTNGCAKKCPYDENTLDYEECMSNLMRDAFDLINRQQAEIERIRSADPMDFCGVLCDFSEGLINKARAEAIKEFVAKAKKHQYTALCWDGTKTAYKVVNVYILENIAKEILGENYE